jgi:hypothetical protein
MGIHAGKDQRGDAVSAADDDRWERLLKLRERLRKDVTYHDKATENLVKIGEEIGNGWQSEKSAVEILSEMRR